MSSASSHRSPLLSLSFLLSVVPGDSACCLYHILIVAPGAFFSYLAHPLYKNTNTTVLTCNLNHYVSNILSIAVNFFITLQA